ncbi:hypothetical protein [Thiomicrorhabdus sp.]|uniref:hypothetical protein n=1 Tax=Thiomicrorhabdus sp. TaxID=2039724 RepID=UPI0029C6FDBD|nr:hypothetical protein [Thiomicrorhabdus sp.]
MNRRLNKAERAVINRKIHALAIQLVNDEKENLYQFFEQSISQDADASELILEQMEKITIEVVYPSVNVKPKSLPF